MKKKLVIISIVILVVSIIGGYFLFKKIEHKKEEEKIKNAIVIIDYKENLTTEFLSEVKVSDFITNINGTITNDYKINTTKIGKKEIKYEYINEENIKLKQSFTINIVDTTAPVIWLGNSYTVSLGSKDTMLEKILCGDNYDANPTCEIIGEYDMNVAGTYPLTFKATDSSGNVTEKDFNLNVKKPVPNTGNNTTNNNTPAPKTNFSDVIANYKNANTEIGLDISEWQGVVDFNKLKEAGVEFVFLRVGGTKGITGDYFLDSKFEDNIKKANEAGMPVGIYFYSYANSKEKAIKDAKWILEQIKDYKIDLPIAFDWENWSFYNEFNLSFFGLTDMANAFLDTFKDAGYQGLLYSSKTYLENIWQKTDYPVWLAHYAKSTSYKGEFEFWQICSNGRVDGINGDVDINIRYKK